MKQTLSRAKNFKFKISNFPRRKVYYLLLVMAVIGLGIFLSRLAVKPAGAAPWASTMSDFLKRKQITLVNNSGQDFEANTTYQFTVNTRELYNQNSLQSDCDDLRVFYQPDTSTATAWNHITVTTATGISASSIKFGLQNSTYFSGLLDDVRIYNYALTPLQIKNLYNEGSSVRFGN